ncbi:Superfamily II DNA and RNA helicase [Amycolatopsis xylanica]|uniref:Superfamily II DNA and RNA helicase n=1 Tax=Amycolatopsis xylanica TaxID=589385 RepID=A0A1H3NAN9_9PSEU|nr:DEAD/DEAH box helicase [Amycolatopsis xylanica]SDY85962.1 Superfamily II DNA and RNA helicase [Amycolatopsis xylanica]
MNAFAELGLPTTLVTALSAQGIDTPFPIQAATLPHSLEGRDVLGRGRTGSGKTYAFVLPVLARLSQGPTRRKPFRPRALILAPTRELVTQIEASIAPLAKALQLKVTTIFGGVSPNPQITALRDGVDIVVACPGRLLDHMQSGNAKLDNIDITVLDEADHMADLGFLPAVRRLLDQTPPRGQRLLFSATLDAGVDVLVKRFMNDPVTHSVDSAQSPVDAMTHHVLHVEETHRFPVLVDLTAAPGRTLVFTRTKHRAKALTRKLNASGVSAVELHGNLGQNARTRNLAAFTDGTAKTLVATDIAARGIHVDDVTLVIHHDPPVEHKAYLHRSGRTARAGASGTVITLMTDEQVADVRDLARKAGIKPTTTQLGPGHPLLAELAPGERKFATVKQATNRSMPKQVSASGKALPEKDEKKPRRGGAPGRGRGGQAQDQPRRGGQSRRGGSGAQGESRRGGSAGQSSRGASAGQAARGSSAGQASRRGTAAGSGQGQAKGRGQSGGGTPARRGGAAAFSSGTRAGSRRSGR